jgi:hypothetical protein
MDAAGLGISMRQPVRHLREPYPVNPLSGPASHARPEERSAADLQLAEFEILAIELQRERGLRLGERRVRDLRPNSIPRNPSKAGEQRALWSSKWPPLSRRSLLPVD